jgi:hypothetical protein
MMSKWSIFVNVTYVCTYVSLLMMMYLLIHSFWTLPTLGKLPCTFALSTTSLWTLVKLFLFFCFFKVRKMFTTCFICQKQPFSYGKKLVPIYCSHWKKLSLVFLGKQVSKQIIGKFKYVCMYVYTHVCS